MCFSSGVYLYFTILMYVKHHEQFEIGCGAILNKIYYIISEELWLTFKMRLCSEDPENGGPTTQELVRLLDQCDLSNSRSTTPSASPSTFVLAAAYQMHAQPIHKRVHDLQHSTTPCVSAETSTPQSSQSDCDSSSPDNSQM